MDARFVWIIAFSNAIIIYVGIYINMYTTKIKICVVYNSFLSIYRDVK